VLHPPGTYNHKGDQRRAVTILSESGIRYTPPELEAASWLTQAPGASRSRDGDDHEAPPAHLEPIVDGCGWLRHCRDDATTLTEPEWYAMLSMLGRCEDGDELAHAWSKPYPGYTPENTDAKLNHALGAGPRTCPNIATLTGNRYCRDCPSWGRIKSPITLGYRRQASDERHTSQDDGGDPWRFIKDAPTFLAEPQPEFDGLAKDLLAPRAITMLAAPRGLGKSQVAHSLGVALATAGIFRGERVKPTRVLLLDRDNPEYIIRQRLQAWGADVARNLHILTRQHAPSLRHRDAWANFPLDNYDVIIMDAVGSFTEGITEKEGKQTTEVLATIIDLARKGLGVLLLQNATKDGLNFKGREEWADRVDIIYELRDATDFIPPLKRPWWEELPEAHEGAWAARAARRKGRCDFRLAFIPSKYRLGPEPEPFCLELQLPGGRPWSLEDVTAKLQESGIAAKAEADAVHRTTLAQATQGLLALVIDRAEAQRHVHKIAAETSLQKEHEIKRADARDIIKENTGVLWVIASGDQGRGKGPVQILIPLKETSYTPPDNGRITDVRQGASDKGAGGTYSAEQSHSGRQDKPPGEPRGAKAAEADVILPGFGGVDDSAPTDTPDDWEEGVL
jgi:hypothetical protein